MIENQLVIGILMILVTVIFHVTALVYLSNMLDRLVETTRITSRTFRLIYFLSIAVIFIVTIHTVESLGWATIYYFSGEIAEYSQALYFSVVTSTTLGYGDITLSEKWQLLASFEAVGGLILFGVSTAFLFEVLRSLFEGEPG